MVDRWRRQVWNSLLYGCSSLGNYNSLPLASSTAANQALGTPEYSNVSACCIPVSAELASSCCLRGININSKNVRVVELLHNRVHFACK